MEVCGDSGTQYGESEKWIISFLPRSGGRTFQYSGEDVLVTFTLIYVDSVLFKPWSTFSVMSIICKWNEYL
jgi:hypothetical protein